METNVYGTFISSLVTGIGAFVLIAGGLWIRGKVVSAFKKKPPAPKDEDA